MEQSIADMFPQPQSQIWTSIFGQPPSMITSHPGSSTSSRYNSGSVRPVTSAAWPPFNPSRPYPGPKPPLPISTHSLANIAGSGKPNCATASFTASNVAGGDSGRPGHIDVRCFGSRARPLIVAIKLSSVKIEPRSGAFGALYRMRSSRLAADTFRKGP